VASRAPQRQQRGPVAWPARTPTSGQARRPPGGAGHVGEPTRL